MFTNTQAAPAAGRFYPMSRNELIPRIACIPRSRCCSSTVPLRLHLRNALWETAHGHQLCTFVPMRYFASLSLPMAVRVPLARQALDYALEYVSAFGEHDSTSFRGTVFVRAFLGPLARLTITRHDAAWPRKGWGPGYCGSLIALPRRRCSCHSHEVLLRTTIRSRRFWL